MDDASTAADESSTLISVDKSGADLSIPLLREIARAHLDVRANAEPLGNSWLLGAKDLAASAAWVRLLGLVGACLTVLAIGFTTLAEFRRFGREVAPLSALAGGYGFFGSIAAWSLLFPTVLAAAVGSTISMWLTAPITVGGAAARAQQPLSRPGGRGECECRVALSLGMASRHPSRCRLAASGRLSAVLETSHG